MPQNLELSYLILTFLLAIAAIFSKKRFIVIWLAIFSIYKIVASIMATDISVEELTADSQARLHVQHNIIEIVGLNSEEHLMQAFKKDFSFSDKTIQLINRRPTFEQVGKLIYRVTYRHRKYF